MTSKPPDHPSTNARFRLQIWHFAFLITACGFGYFCWWASLEESVKITNLLRIEVMVTLPYSYDREISREQEVEQVQIAGQELRAILEARLQKEGLAKIEIAGANPDAFKYRTSFEGSPEIEVEFSTMSYVDESGLHYCIAANYACSPPRASADDHTAMSQLVNEFEQHLEFWLEESRNELLAKRNELE